MEAHLLGARMRMGFAPWFGKAFPGHFGAIHEQSGAEKQGFLGVLVQDAYQQPVPVFLEHPMGFEFLQRALLHLHPLGSGSYCHVQPPEYRPAWASWTCAVAHGESRPVYIPGLLFYI
jgi:hypothetical protein